MSYYVTDGDEAAKAPATKKTHSTPLPFPAQFACALFVLDIAGDGAKSAPDGQKPSQSCCKEDAQKASRPCLRRCWAELHGWSFTRSCFWGWTLAQNQASLDWASSVSYKQEKARVFMF